MTHPHLPPWLRRELGAVDHIRIPPRETEDLSATQAPAEEVESLDFALGAGVVDGPASPVQLCSPDDTAAAPSGASVGPDRAVLSEASLLDCAPTSAGSGPASREADPLPERDENDLEVPLHHPADGPPPRDKLGEDLAGSPQPWAETPHAPQLKHGITSRPNTRTSRSCYDLPPPEPDDPLLGFAPVPHVAPRRNSITPDRQRAFIAELAACGIVTQAARRVGISCEAVYNLRNRPGAEEFRAAWELAFDRGVMRVEDGALARAVRGEERMVVSAGKHMGTETRYNDALVMFFLRCRRRDRYPPTGANFDALRPGHPVYERIRTEVLAAELGDEEEVLASIDATLERILERQEAARLRGYGPADHYAEYSEVEES